MAQFVQRGRFAPWRNFVFWHPHSTLCAPFPLAVAYSIFRQIRQLLLSTPLSRTQASCLLFPKSLQEMPGNLYRQITARGEGIREGRLQGRRETLKQNKTKQIYLFFFFHQEHCAEGVTTSCPQLLITIDENWQPSSLRRPRKFPDSLDVCRSRSITFLAS